MSTNQKTITKKILFDGLGLHSGLPIKMYLEPAEIDSGILFIRTDLKKREKIYANWKNIVSTNLCTKISNNNGCHISTVEHLMFALYSLGITNLNIYINGPEVPILDGSAKIFIEQILSAGLVDQNKYTNQIRIKKSFEIKDKKKFIKFEPTNKKYLEIDYTINYDDFFIKKQNFYLTNVQKNYHEVFTCRTFCHQEDLEKIFSMGLAKGGSLDNAIVISGTKVLNQDGLRFPNEFVRHKILDCIGDLYLSGFFINGKIICNQGGHELTSHLLKEIFKSKNNFDHYVNEADNENSKIKNHHLKKHIEAAV